MTKCDIAIMIKENLYLLARCGSSGYFDGVGITLLEHYTDEFNILDMITAGDFSPLEETAKLTKENNLGFDNGVSGYPVVLKDIDVDKWEYTCGDTTYTDRPAEYRYLWKNGEWWYTTWSDNDDTDESKLLPWIKLEDARNNKEYNPFCD